MHIFALITSAIAGCFIGMALCFSVPAFLIKIKNATQEVESMAEKMEENVDLIESIAESIPDIDTQTEIDSIRITQSALQNLEAGNIETAKRNLADQLANFYTKWKPEFEGDSGWNEDIDKLVIEIKKASEKSPAIQAAINRAKE